MALLVCSGCSTRYAPGVGRCPHCGLGGGAEEGNGSRLPFLDVVCPTSGCRAEGVVRRIHMPMIVPGVVEQPTYVCMPCSGVMLPVLGWPSPVGGMEGTDMPKITRHGGPSNATERKHPGTGTPTEPVEMPADGTGHEPTGDGSGEAPPPAAEAEEQVKKPKRRTSKTPAADGADTSLVITAEAQVTRPDGTVS